MPPINTSTAIIAMVGLFLVARGYWPLLRPGLGSPWADNIMKGVIIIAVTLTLRSGYWDVAQWALGPAWPPVRDALGGQTFSTAFNIPLIVGVYYILKSRLYLIPEDEREQWRWWSAWAHPGDRCVIDWRRPSKR